MIWSTILWEENYTFICSMRLLNNFPNELYFLILVVNLPINQALPWSRLPSYLQKRVIKIDMMRALIWPHCRMSMSYTKIFKKWKKKKKGIILEIEQSKWIWLGEGLILPHCRMSMSWTKKIQEKREYFPQN